MQVRYEKVGRTGKNRFTGEQREPIDKAYYICQTYNRLGKNACTSHKIEARDLYNLVLKDIQAGKLDRHEILTATPVVEQVMWDESQMYLKAGEQISVDQLLAGLIIMSANDAALTLGERVAGGSAGCVRRDSVAREGRSSWWC